MLCMDCKWWDYKNAWGERKDKAACRALPPRIRKSGMACATSANWPSTHELDWCSAFTPRNVGVSLAKST